MQPLHFSFLDDSFRFSDTCGVPDKDDWERLAEYLTARRMEISIRDYGQVVSRKEFFRRRGDARFERTADTLENHRETVYARATFPRADVLYEWEPGSTRAVLNGGRPTPKDAAPEEPPPHRQVG